LKPDKCPPFFAEIEGTFYIPTVFVSANRPLDNIVFVLNDMIINAMRKNCTCFSLVCRWHKKKEGEIHVEY